MSPAQPRAHAPCRTAWLRVLVLLAVALFATAAPTEPPTAPSAAVSGTAYAAECDTTDIPANPPVARQSHRAPAPLRPATPTTKTPPPRTTAYAPPPTPP
ncbi:hypothetical protein OK074_8906, partial [Actinobacteria bacterium OK074]